MTREEICEETGMASNGTLSQCLENLVNCDLVRTYPGYGKKERKSIYQLVDFYTLFYHRFIKRRAKMAGEYWIHMQGTAKHSSWSGYAFEQLCLAHYPQIAKALGISGIMTDIFSWSSEQKNGGAQIDLIIKRADRVINICEIKYWNEPYRLTQKYLDDLQNKINLFRSENKVSQAIHLVMITTKGLANPDFSSLVQKNLTADILFDE